MAGKLPTPLIEVIVLIAAGFALLAVFSLWWVFGYALVIEPTHEIVMSAGGLSTTTLKTVATLKETKPTTTMTVATSHSILPTTTVPVTTTLVTTTTPTLKYVEDTWVSESSPDENLGTDQTLSQRYNVNGNRYILLKFYLDRIDKDLSDGTTITSAKLKLYMRGTEHTGGMNVGVYKITGDWSASDVTWNTRPDFDETPIDVKSISADVGWKEWDVTSLVQESLASGEVNVLIKGVSYTTSVMNFDSSENRDSSLWPKLVIS